MRRFAISLSAALLISASAPARRFHDDDPIQREPPHRNATNVKPRKLSDYYDFFSNSFGRLGERHPKGKFIPAQAVNTLGDAYDSSWYSQRHYYRPMSIAELVRGPGDRNPPDTSGSWKVVGAKSEGITPGFMIVDPKGRRYLLKFDPKSNPEIATSVDVMGSKLFHALGYHVPENYIVRFTDEQLVLGDDVQLKDSLGRARKMTGRDLTELLMRVDRQKDRRYRGTASLLLAGQPVREFRYHGTRKDDPNDVVPHEHRRDLRGLSVFCAWLNHDDSRAINTLDMLVEEGGRKFIRHYLIDFGSILGSASNGPNSPHSGFGYLFEAKPAAAQFFSLGVHVPRWARAKYPHLPSVGMLEADAFDAEAWVAEYPNPAFTNRLPDDAFWGAKQVMAFTDEQISAIVKTAQYSDPRAEQWVTECLIKRRDKIGRAFFARVLPLDRFEVRDGRLVFEDLAVKHKFIPARNYSVEWSVFDNEKETRTAIPGETTLQAPSARVPEGGFLAASIHGGDPKKSVMAYLRQRGGRLIVVGLDRTW
ncbi:MAG: hypothetical protein ACRD44_19220 [Bryobacteraceae bacterium]